MKYLFAILLLLCSLVIVETSIAGSVERDRRDIWLVHIITMLLLLGIMTVLAEATAVVPFIVTIF